MKKIYNSISEMVGKTPMLNMSSFVEKLNLVANVFGKCEFYNPLFSIKDRVALSMIEDAEKKHKITKETIFVEATSGNTGIALAGLCASKGYKLVITMPEDMSSERILLIKHFGADVILTPKEDGMKGALAKAQILANKNPNVIWLKQFENEANINVHRFDTALDIMEDIGGDIDVLISAVGTSGTLNGIASTLRTTNPDLYVVAVEPKSSPVLSGGVSGSHKIMGIGAGFVPPFYDASLVDEVVCVSDEDAIKMAKVAAATQGLPVGISAGAALKGAVEIGHREEFRDKNIVVILPDSVERYLSMGIF